MLLCYVFGILLYFKKWGNVLNLREISVLVNIECICEIKN